MLSERGKMWLDICCDGFGEDDPGRCATDIRNYISTMEVALKRLIETVGALPLLQTNAQLAVAHASAVSALEQVH